MRKQNLLFFGMILIGLNCYTQNLTCLDFKTGKFYIPMNDKLEKVTIQSKDSVSELKLKQDKNINKWVIIRKKNTQTEWMNGLNNGTPLYAKLEWIDNCTYRLTYDGNKTKLKKHEKWTNENNGIVVTNVQILGKCMEYKATMTTNNGEKISQSGTICKE